MPELEDLGFRETLHGDYRILYLHSGRVVEIVTVRHGAKLLDPDSLSD